MHVVIAMIIDAPGAVVTTSTRPDNLAVTLAARRAAGPVMVFDPQNLAGGGRGEGQAGSLAWPLERGCADPGTALVRAEALVPAAGGSGVENGNFWRQQALTVTRCLLHAAALGGAGAGDIFRWSHSAAAAKEAVGILGRHAGAAEGWGRGLDAIIAADQRTRDSVWAMVANTFAPLADPAVLAAVTARPGQQILDPEKFLASRGTIYLLGTAAGAAAAAPLVAALTEDLIHAARQLAARSPRQRLDPPLLLALDEAANYPLPSLPSLMSEGGGTGITTLTVLQSLAQARDKWGAQAGAAIWDAAIVKIILGGSGNAADLADISRLAGEIPVTEWSRTLAAGPGAGSASASVRYRPVIEPADIRRLGYGTGLLLLRTAPPILLRLRPWTARPDAKALAAAQAAWEHDRAGDA
jgi:type IV secretion system protein VirD4